MRRSDSVRSGDSGMPHCRLSVGHAVATSSSDSSRVEAVPHRHERGSTRVKRRRRQLVSRASTRPHDTLAQVERSRTETEPAPRCGQDASISEGAITDESRRQRAGHFSSRASQRHPRREKISRAARCDSARLKSRAKREMNDSSAHRTHSATVGEPTAGNIKRACSRESPGPGLPDTSRTKNLTRQIKFRSSQVPSSGPKPLAAGGSRT
jgi:hypothetical protein